MAAARVCEQQQQQRQQRLQQRQNSDSDNDEFYDCHNEFVNGSDRLKQQSLVCNGSFGKHTFSADNWKHRRSLPALMLSRADFSIWSFLRLCIGKELSKITMPIVFNEPISFLQRIVEYVEYGCALLDRAAASSDPIERMELVTAFAVSASASNWERLGKPFNPLLGETFELDCVELGFRVVCEQVEHHPPVSAFHVESANYSFHGHVHPKVKFWGSSIQVIPKGLMTLELPRHKEAYSWQNINCTIHNVIIGKYWVEHTGEMEVTNHRTKQVSVMQFKPCGWTGSELHKVHGYLYDSNRRKLRCFYGKWVEALYSCDVAVWERLARSSWREVEEPHSKSKAEHTSMPDDLPQQVSINSCNLHLPGQKLLWQATPRPENAEKYYNFTLFALMLNELDSEQHANIAPTDSRLRPDMRLMEAADVERASAEKSRLEEKQREVRKQIRKTKQEFQPLWFKLNKNRFTGCDEWQFTGEYWKRDWSRCPNIF